MKIPDIKTGAFPRLNNRENNSSILPFNYTFTLAGRIGSQIILEYEDNKTHYEQECPEAASRFARPSIRTIEAIWNEVLEHVAAEYLTSDHNHTILPNWIRLQEFEGDTDRQESTKKTVQEALVIALDTFMTFGKRAAYITYNDIFDALCFRYSYLYRESPAAQVRDMTDLRAKYCRRELLLNGIDVNKIWDMLVKHWLYPDNPLFIIHQRPKGICKSCGKERSRGICKICGKDITPENAREMKKILPSKLKLYTSKFSEILNNDEPYINSRHQGTGLTALIVSDPPMDHTKPIPIEAFCADVPYNQIEVGENSDNLLSIQSKTQIFLDVNAFKQDYEHLLSNKRTIYTELIDCYGMDPDISKTPGFNENGIRAATSQRDYQLILRKKEWTEIQQKEVKRLLSSYDRVALDVAKWATLHEQVGNKPSPLKISNSFYRTINRRYQPQYFWPTYVTNKPEEVDHDDPIENDDETSRERTHRGRWFRAINPQGDACNLVGVDISSSQTQIIAALMGIDNFEQAHMGPHGEPFKKYLAETAWSLNLDNRKIFEQDENGRDYSGPNDPRLQALVKNTWLRTVYGSLPYWIMRGQDDTEEFGPGWKKGPLKKTNQNGDYAMYVNIFLDTVMKEFPAVDSYLKACKQAALFAAPDETLSYTGITFTDPYDGAQVRWNPVARAIKDQKNNGHTLELSLPGIKQGKRFEAYYPNPDNEFPVDTTKIHQMVAPCLIHMLDGYYSSLVMEGLNDKGITDFISIHDCWLVPDEVQVKGKIVAGMEILVEAIESANDKWYQGLESVFTELESYLTDPKDYDHLEKIQNAHSKWKARKRTGPPPRFLYTPED